MPSDEIRVSWEGKVKEIRRNDKLVRDRKELIELNPSIVFCHETLPLLLENPNDGAFSSINRLALYRPGT